MSEKMRDEFESWAISCHMCTYLDGVEYRHQSTEWAWMAWQTSRAALVVELPDEYKDRYLDKYQEGFNDAVESCRNRLEDLGLELE